jgi:type IV secretory pathway VirD2 relaxase
MVDDDFRPKLGRIRDRKGRKALPYIRRVLRTAEKAASAAGRSGRRSRFTGARIGRGRAQGTVAAMGRRGAGRRRVIVKTRVVRIKGADHGAARAHLRYVQRDGVTQEGESGHLYDAATDRAEGKSLMERSAQDRHQFRFIVSAEDGAALGDLKPFIRDLMRQMESDLGTRLDWVAVDHFNTGHPHSHVVLRGKDEHGKDLVIARDYIAYGMRGRASDLVTRELGPETELEVIRKLEREVDQERFTRFDRAILRDAPDGVLTLAVMPERDPPAHALRMGRLRTLERLGLAGETGAGAWRIAPNLEPTLRRLGERGDIIKIMHRELQAAGISRSAADHAIFDATAPGARVVGRIVAEGISDELRDRRYMIVDGIDGRTHYVDIGVRQEGDAPLARNMVVEVSVRGAEPRAVDHIIAVIAERNNGVYTAELHRGYDQRASSEYVASHIRRLEAMRRQGHVERTPDGSWRVGKDYLARATRYEAARQSRIRLTVLSWQALDELPGGVGATWLDRQLITRSPEALRASGFGAEVETAVNRRRQWLLDRGLAREGQGRIVYARDLLGHLQRRELASVGAKIAQETGLDYAEAITGEEVRGTYRRSMALASGRFALIERARDFTLVPWRPVLERAKGQTVSGIIGGEGVSWSIGKRRGLGL